MRMNRASVSALAAALLAGCGGGLYIDAYDDDWRIDAPPSVSLAAGQSSVAAGGSVRVVAAAVDEDGIAWVTLYRYEPATGTWLLVERDSSAPYEWTAVAPNDGRANLLLYARATDGSGRSNDSASIAIPITP